MTKMTLACFSLITMNHEQEASCQVTLACKDVTSQLITSKSEATTFQQRRQ